MGILHLTGAVYEAIRAHGEETYPHECCGVLLARSLPDGRFSPDGQSLPDVRVIVAAVRAGNMRTDSAHNRYQIAPVELVKIEREARRQGLEIAGFYHSHPDHPAHWSATDLAEAHWLGSSYVITAVALGKSKETNSFQLAGTTEEDKRFEQETVVVTDESIGEAAT
jgi:proteasome lid subunit RPN8/RPN11